MRSRQNQAISSNTNFEFFEKLCILLSPMINMTIALFSHLNLCWYFQSDSTNDNHSVSVSITVSYIICLTVCNFIGKKSWLKKILIKVIWKNDSENNIYDHFNDCLSESLFLVFWGKDEREEKLSIHMRTSSRLLTIVNCKIVEYWQFFIFGNRWLGNCTDHEIHNYLIL